MHVTLCFWCLKGRKVKFVDVLVRTQVQYNRIVLWFAAIRPGYDGSKAVKRRQVLRHRLASARINRRDRIPGSMWVPHP